MRKLFSYDEFPTRLRAFSSRNIRVTRAHDSCNAWCSCTGETRVLKIRVANLESSDARLSIPSSSVQHPKERNIDGCGRGVRTSIGTLTSTKAHPTSPRWKREGLALSRLMTGYPGDTHPLLHNFNIIRRTQSRNNLISGARLKFHLVGGAELR